MIKREILAQAILDFQKRSLPDLIERELQIDLEVPIKRAITILGPRRSGKTYYIYSLIKTLVRRKIDKERILYLNFEDPKFVGASLDDLLFLLDTFYEIYPKNKTRKIWLFLDEVQNVKNWETFVRGVLDKENAGVFVTGSSSKLLSKEIATSLRGRTLSYLLLPFSFSEFLRTRKIIYKKYLSSQGKAKLLNAFLEYFSYGGYPEAIIYKKEWERIINEIIEVTIYRDLIERYNLRNIKVIKIMFNYLVKSREFSIHKFYNFLKSLSIKVSKNSIYNYLDYFHDCFIFFPLRKFSYSLKNIEQSIPKIYSVDNALITKIIGDNKSKKFENLLFQSFLRKGYIINQDLFYYSLNGEEVDFIIKKGKKIVSLIQVCYDISDYITKEREFKNLIKASERLKCNNLIVVNLDQDEIENYKSKRIKLIPLWKWLLEEDKH